MQRRVLGEIAGLRQAGRLKPEVPLGGAQGPRVRIDGAREVVNLCSNDYLSLANDPVVVDAAIEALRHHGFGMASVRFISGTHELHRQLEQAIAEFVGTEAAIVLSSCFDANSGLFDALLGPGDLVLSDELNHASIIEGVRLCRAERVRYPHADVDAVEKALQQRPKGSLAAVVTDGVFSMDGSVAPLRELAKVTEAYDAILVVDDSHGIGVLGATGRGSAEHLDLATPPDVTTGTFGKALGGASGGFVAASEAVVELLRQRSRPYLFSNAVPPHVAAGSLAALDLLRRNARLVKRLQGNAAYLRARLVERGFEILPGRHPIVPVMTRDVGRTQAWAETLRAHGVLATGIWYPVVPEGTERIRLQAAAGHSTVDLGLAVDALTSAREARR